MKIIFEGNAPWVVFENLKNNLDEIFKNDEFENKTNKIKNLNPDILVGIIGLIVSATGIIIDILLGKSNKNEVKNINNSIVKIEEKNRYVIDIKDLKGNYTLDIKKEDNSIKIKIDKKD
jgi:hypothetical protein